MTPAFQALAAALDRRSGRDIDPAAAWAAAQLAARFGGHARAVLFYGSCLRTGAVEGHVLDFYVIVDDYRAAYGSFWKAAANHLLPPNVFYFEGNRGDGKPVRAKYAVLSLPHFLELTDIGCFNAAVWARFAQPIALAYVADGQTRETTLQAIAQAHMTVLAKTMGPAVASADPLDPWRRAFSITYRTEWRAEKGGRAADIVALNADYYRAVTALVLAAIGEDQRYRAAPMRADGVDWFLRRVEGKAMHVLRLIKAALTFDGGIDYLAWKIERHSGVKLDVKPWHRRHPVAAGLWLFLALRLKGAFR